MDDVTETALVQLALLEARLTVNRAARETLCAQFNAPAATDRRALRDLRQRIACTEAAIVRDRQRRAELLQQVNAVVFQPGTPQHASAADQVAA